jgi:hypothetical protein
MYLPRNVEASVARVINSWARDMSVSFTVKYCVYVPQNTDILTATARSWSVTTHAPNACA